MRPETGTGFSWGAHFAGYTGHPPPGIGIRSDELAGAESYCAEVYRLSMLEPDGRPHVTALLGIWLEGLCNSVRGPDEREAKNLTANRHCVLTKGQRALEGLDPVIEGTAEGVSDYAELGRVASNYETKYGPHFVAPNGTWSDLGHAIRRAEVLVYRVAPETGLDLPESEGRTRPGHVTDRPTAAGRVQGACCSGLSSRRWRRCQCEGSPGHSWWAQF